MPVHSVSRLEEVFGSVSGKKVVVQGFEPFHFSEPADAAILQADHVEYIHLTQADLPGVTVLLDGRNMVKSAGDIRVVPLGR